MRGVAGAVRTPRTGRVVAAVSILLLVPAVIMWRAWPTAKEHRLSLKDAVSRYERAMILQSLEMANGVQKRAAELLQLKPSTLNEMMKRLGIHTRSSAVIEDEVTIAE